MFNNGSFLSVRRPLTFRNVRKHECPCLCKGRLPKSGWFSTFEDLNPPPLPPEGPRQMTFQNVKNDAGQKQYSPVFFVKASPAEGWRRFHKEHGLCPPLGFQPALSAEGPKAEVFGGFGGCLGGSGFRCGGCFGVLGAVLRGSGREGQVRRFRGLVVGFNFCSAGQKRRF